LVPAYQRALAESDPTKLNFRFYLVENSPVNDAIVLSNGIMLVPKKVMDQLIEDSQLAAVLADNIAAALEKQEYRKIPIREKALGAELGAGGAGLFVPGLGLATLVTSSAANSALRRLVQQTDRVSLELLSDSGYDVREAPIAWWKLSSKHPDELWLTEPPEKSGYLFSVLATRTKTAAEISESGPPTKAEAGQSK